MEKKRILVVDDEDQLRGLLAEFLEHFGYEVYQTANGATALMLIRNGKRFDAVITDVQMPSMTGWELYENAVQANADLMERFIFATGDPYCEEIKPIKAAGKRLLLKPYDLGQVRDVISAVMSGH